VKKKGDQTKKTKKGLAGRPEGVQSQKTPKLMEMGGSAKRGRGRGSCSAGGGGEISWRGGGNVGKVTSCCNRRACKKKRKKKTATGGKGGKKGRHWGGRRGTFLFREEK